MFCMCSFVVSSAIRSIALISLFLRPKARCTTSCVSLGESGDILLSFVRGAYASLMATSLLDGGGAVPATTFSIEHRNASQLSSLDK